MLKHLIAIKCFLNMIEWIVIKFSLYQWLWELLMCSQISGNWKINSFVMGAVSINLV